MNLSPISLEARAAAYEQQFTTARAADNPTKRLEFLRWQTLRVGGPLRETFDEHYGAQAGEANINDILGPVFVRFVASCLSFMEQRITIPVSRPASRAPRRRMERNHATFQAAAEVQVIELRRRERRHQEHADDEDKESPEWHGQWLVTGGGTIFHPLRCTSRSTSRRT